MAAVRDMSKEERNRARKGLIALRFERPQELSREACEVPRPTQGPLFDLPLEARQRLAAALDLATEQDRQQALAACAAGDCALMIKLRHEYQRAMLARPAAPGAPPMTAVGRRVQQHYDGPEHRAAVEHAISLCDVMRPTSIRQDVLHRVGFDLCVWDDACMREQVADVWARSNKGRSRKQYAHDPVMMDLRKSLKGAMLPIAQEAMPTAEFVAALRPLMRSTKSASMSFEVSHGGEVVAFYIGDLDPCYVDAPLFYIVPPCLELEHDVHMQTCDAPGPWPEFRVNVHTLAVPVYVRPNSLLVISKCAAFALAPKVNTPIVEYSLVNWRGRTATVRRSIVVAMLSTLKYGVETSVACMSEPWPRASFLREVAKFDAPMNECMDSNVPFKPVALEPIVAPVDGVHPNRRIFLQRLQQTPLAKAIEGGQALELDELCTYLQDCGLPSEYAELFFPRETPLSYTPPLTQTPEEWPVCCIPGCPELASPVFGVAGVCSDTCLGYFLDANTPTPKRRRMEDEEAELNAMLDKLDG